MSSALHEKFLPEIIHEGVGNRGSRCLRNPFSNNELRIKPIDERYLYRNANFLDVKAKNYDDGYKYETHCFKQLAMGERKRINSFLLGPHLIDNVLPKAISSGGQPDTIYFNIHSESEWQIAELFEFKLGKTINGVEKKLRGFSTLLSELRLHPELLPRILKATIPILENKFPDRFDVPEDKDVRVKFVSPHDMVGGVIFEGFNGHNFQNVEHLLIKR
jgi:hypothetical protein